MGSTLAKMFSGPLTKTGVQAGSNTDYFNSPFEEAQAMAADSARTAQPSTSDISGTLTPDGDNSTIRTVTPAVFE